MLSGLEIARRVRAGDISISPWNEKQLNPASYNVRLDYTLLTYSCPTLDMKAENPTVKIDLSDTGYILRPGSVYLASTIERTSCSTDLNMLLDGRSSVGRLGLFVHVTAGYGDPGFDGTWTLELVATQPIRIYPGVCIGQVRFEHVTGEVVPYQGKYQYQSGPRPSGLWKEFN